MPKPVGKERQLVFQNNPAYISIDCFTLALELCGELVFCKTSVIKLLRTIPSPSSLVSENEKKTLSMRLRGIWSLWQTPWVDF